MGFTRTGAGMLCAAAAGSALTLGAVGLVFGGAAWSEARTVEGADTWSPDVQRAADRGSALGDASTVVFVAAGAMAIGAVAACWLGWRNARAGSPSRPTDHGP